MQAKDDAVDKIMDTTIKETLTQPSTLSSSSESSSSVGNGSAQKVKPANIQSSSPAQPTSQGLVPEYNGTDRNAWIFGFNPQQELWNGRLAMLGFVAYLLWDLAGYSVVRDALHWMQ